MRFDIMTLFPEYVDFILNESIIKRARESGAIEIHTHNIRDYSEDKHRRVDDTPYGGGMGMLMAAPPIYRCFKAIEEQIGTDTAEKPYVVYMSPRGTVFNQMTAKRLSGNNNLIILCGHYEGVDERIIEEIVDEEISIGDYVLTGGEVPACILVDCVARMCPGVLSDDECFEKESFGQSTDESNTSKNTLLEFPQYTRPYEFNGRKVPDVLISGNHANIEKWRLEKSVELTMARRPELITDPDEYKPKEKKKRRKSHDKPTDAQQPQAEVNVITETESKDEEC